MIQIFTAYYYSVMVEIHFCYIVQLYTAESFLKN